MGHAEGYDRGTYHCVIIRESGQIETGDATLGKTILEIHSQKKGVPQGFFRNVEGSIENPFGEKGSLDMLMVLWGIVSGKGIYTVVL